MISWCLIICLSTVFKICICSAPCNSVAQSSNIAECCFFVNSTLCHNDEITIIIRFPQTSTNVCPCEMFCRSIVLILGLSLARPIRGRCERDTAWGAIRSPPRSGKYLVISVLWDGCAALSIVQISRYADSHIKYSLTSDQLSRWGRLDERD